MVSRRTLYSTLLVLLLVAVLAGAAVAQTVVRENYAEPRKPTPAATSTTSAPSFVSAFSTLDGTDSTTWGDTLAGRTIPTGGDPTLEVTVRSSTAAGITACVAVGHRDRFGGFQGIAGVQTITLAGGNAGGFDGTGWYGGEKLYFPVTGWPNAEVRVYDVSGSNTVSLKPVTLGATARAAE